LFRELGKHRIQFPVMDGFEFINQVQLRDDWKDIPVIVITAKDLTLEERQLLTGRVKNIFQKGAFNQKQLYEELRKRIPSKGVMNLFRKR
jgi:CheY-like chemotaxis protein